MKQAAPTKAISAMGFTVSLKRYLDTNQSFEIFPEVGCTNEM